MALCNCGYKNEGEVINEHSCIGFMSIKLEIMNNLLSKALSKLKADEAKSLMSDLDFFSDNQGE